ncbi:hypothetical protein OH492_14530 [Vibrio chagasii]|nr:hypothetical protein [Vibrio chagasii]
MAALHEMPLSAEDGDGTSVVGQQEQGNTTAEPPSTRTLLANETGDHTLPDIVNRSLIWRKPASYSTPTQNPSLELINWIGAEFASRRLSGGR